MELSKSDINDIKSTYRTAKNKPEQLYILSDLYLTPVEKIAEICGAEPPKSRAGNKTANVGLTKSATKKPRNAFDQSFKDNVINAVLVEGLKVTEAAERFGVDVKNVSNWVYTAKRKQAGARPGKEKTAPCKDSNEPQHTVQSSDVSCVSVAIPERDLSDDMRRIDEGVNHLSLGIACLIDLGILPEELPNLIGELQIKAEGFRAGIEFAMLHK